MAKETIIDYETVKKEKEVVYCDLCGRKAEKGTVDMAINPRLIQTENWSKKWIYDDELEADKELKGRQHFENAMFTPDHKNIKYGVGKQTKTVGAEADAMWDMCYSCVADLADIDIDPEREVKDIDVEEGKVTVEVEEEVVHNYPRPDIKSEDALFAPLTFLLSPILSGFLFFDMVEGEEESFLIGMGMLGMFAWGFGLALFFFTSILTF